MENLRSVIDFGRDKMIISSDHHSADVDLTRLASGHRSTAFCATSPDALCFPELFRKQHPTVALDNFVLCRVYKDPTGLISARGELISSSGPQQTPADNML